MMMAIRPKSVYMTVTGYYFAHIVYRYTPGTKWKESLTMSKTY